MRRPVCVYLLIPSLPPLFRLDCAPRSSFDFSWFWESLSFFFAIVSFVSCHELPFFLLPYSLLHLCILLFSSLPLCLYVPTSTALPPFFVPVHTSTFFILFFYRFYRFYRFMVTLYYYYHPITLFPIHWRQSYSSIPLLFFLLFYSVLFPLFFLSLSPSIPLSFSIFWPSIGLCLIFNFFSKWIPDINFSNTFFVWWVG